MVVETIKGTHELVFQETNTSNTVLPYQLTAGDILPRNTAFNEDFSSDLSELSFLNEASGKEKTIGHFMSLTLSLEYNQDSVFSGRNLYVFWNRAYFN